MKTQSNGTPLPKADEIEAMLPWLVTGKLSRAEAAEVSRYLETHPEAAAHVALAREEQDAAILGNEAIKGPSAAALDRLMAQVAATPQPRSIAIPSPASVWEKIAGFITSLSPNTLGVAGAAAAVLLVLQAVAIGTLVTRDTGSGYQTASGPMVAGDGVEVHVLLQSGVPAGTLTTALREIKGTIVAGPTAEGYYRVRLAADKANPDTAIARAKGRSDIFVLVTKAAR